VRVGVDLVSVQSVREAIAAHGERYLERVYSEREIRDCTTTKGLDPERLAARFAAKEAALKALRPGPDGVMFSSIEVRRDDAGWVELELSGGAAELARAAGMTELTVSIAHENGFACAVVIAHGQSA
jgi:holo-[acyl-carrier protein] synthase